MSNNYYNFTPRFIPGTKVRAQAVNTQFDLLEDAFDLLPAVSGSIALGKATLGVESGSGNAYVVTMPNTRAANANGDEVVFKATHQNSGASTLQVDAIAAVPLVRWDGTALSSGDILVDSYYVARYDSTGIRFLIVAPAQSTIVGAISYATPSGLVKLAASAGTVTTVMRSDADIALDQSITPTWTGAHIFNAPVTFNSTVSGATFSSTATFADGSAATPGIAFTLDTDSGWYRIGANNIGMTLGGVLRFSVDGSGNGVFTGAVSGTNLSASGGANPTASVGLTAVNGSAITFMRSDGAPALSQSIAPTWTAKHIFSQAGSLGANSSTISLESNVPYFELRNTAAAVDTKRWINNLTSTNWQLFAADDAGSAAKIALQFVRSGNAISAMNFGNSTDNPSFTFNGTGVVTAGGVFRGPDGAVGAPAYSFSGDTNTGIFRNSADAFSTTVGGVQATTWFLSGGVGQTLVADGTAAIPGFGFQADPDTGIYRAAANDMRFVAGGAVSMQLTTTAAAFGSALQLAAGDGSGAAPTYTFNNDGDTGIYSAGANSMGFAAGGVARVNLNTTRLLSDLPFHGPDGAVGAPAFSFTNDTDTGIYRSTTNTLNISCGGTSVAQFATTGISVSVNTNTAGVGGSATALPAQPVGYMALIINGTQRRIPYYGD